jgi:diaminohydroxyphosphoribosylaminopyrimidine deaminase/5-amino-6-(5-phosphoribosylamino)uracil reductase
VVPVEGPRISAALRQLVARDIHSVVLEGGGGLHAAAWREGVVDYLQMYVAPVVLGGHGARVPDARGFSTASLSETSIRLLGPDVLIEGYVHRPH